MFAVVAIALMGVVLAVSVVLVGALRMGFRQVMHTTRVEHGRYDHAVTGAIVANVVVLVAGLVVDGHEQLFEKVDLCILWFFAAELAIRLARARLGFFRSPWNTADAIIIVVALLPVTGGGIAVLRLSRLLARSAHLLCVTPATCGGCSKMSTFANCEVSAGN
jgi:hypothetical protein